MVKARIFAAHRRAQNQGITFKQAYAQRKVYEYYLDINKENCLSTGESKLKAHLFSLAFTNNITNKI